MRDRVRSPAGFGGRFGVERADVEWPMGSRKRGMAESEVKKELKRLGCRPREAEQLTTKIVEAVGKRLAGTPLSLQEPAWLNGLVQELPVGIIVAEAPSRRLLLSNQQVEHIWGQPFLAAARAANYSHRQGLHADGRPYQPDEWPLMRSITTGEVVTAEKITFVRGDGTPGTLRVSSAPIRDADAVIIAGVAILDDITAQELTEQALRQQAALLELVPTAVLVRDLHGAVTFWNRAAEQTYGWTAQEARGQITHTLLQTRFPESRQAVDATLRDVGTWEGELEHTRRDGTRIVVASRQALRRDAQGRPLAILELNTDITDRKRAEQERNQLLAAEQMARANAEHAIQVRDEVLRAVSHDLKQPLVRINLQTQLLEEWATRRDLDGADRLRTGLQRIRRATTHMSTWIEDLLDVAQLETGQELALHLAATNLVTLAQEAIADQQRDTPQHPIRLQAAQPAITCLADAARLRRVLDNLLGNAIKYSLDSPTAGEVVVRVRTNTDAAGAWAALEVHDQGIGIPAAEQADVFEPFRRASNVHRIGGSGIGLASARHIVQQHGGRLDLVSQEGVGTTVSVRLPLAAPQTEAVAPEPGEGSSDTLPAHPTDC